MPDVINPTPGRESSDASQNNEILRPGSKILIASPNFLGNTAVAASRLGHQSLIPVLQQMFEEYSYLHQGIKSLVGAENMIVIRNSNYSIGKSGVRVTDMPRELEEAFGVVDFPALDIVHTCWPRNAFSTPGGHLLLDKAAWREPVNAPSFDGIGDGGAVISHPKSKVTFVTEEIVRKFPHEVEYLRELGLNVGTLPLVNPKNRPFFPPDDIDGFSLLIRAQDNDLLYVARSYYRQNSETERTIKKSARKTGVELRVIDDSKLSHLAFNALVFDNGQLIVAEEEDSTLVRQLNLDVGEDNVFQIPPLRSIALSTGGGAGCLTNILPDTKKAEELGN